MNDMDRKIKPCVCALHLRSRVMRSGKKKKSFFPQTFETAEKFTNRKTTSKPREQIIFVCALWTSFYYCIYGSLSLLKSVSQWVIKCEICVHTNHLTARLQKELEHSCQRWLFLTHCNSQKNYSWI